MSEQTLIAPPLHTQNGALAVRPIQDGTYKEGGSVDPRNHPASEPAVIVDLDRGIVTTSRKRIAIVGFAQTTNHLTPFDDPSWCIVTMNEYYRYAKRSDLHIEIHQEQDYLPESVPGYIEWLRSCPIPIFMQHHSRDIPMSVRFPIEHVIDRWGVDYFTCTVAFEIAWAIEQQPDEIGLWGVDLAVGSEYFFERPCAEFWLGVCKGLGIRVTIPKGAALLRGRITSSGPTCRCTPGTSPTRRGCCNRSAMPAPRSPPRTGPPSGCR